MSQDFTTRTSRKHLTMEMDTQGLSMQYLSNDDAVFSQLNDLAIIRDELPKLDARQNSVFGQQFGVQQLSSHKISEQQDEKYENIRFDQIKIKQGREFQGTYFKECRESARQIISLLKLRDNYTFHEHQEYEQVDQFTTINQSNEPQVSWGKKVEPLPIMDEAEVLQENGVTYVVVQGKPLVVVPTMFQFISDLLYLMNCINNNSIAGYSYSRLKFLEEKFQMHEIFNHQQEQLRQKEIKRKDFYNVFKVDTHIHHSAAMSAKHLQNFIIKKYRTSADEYVALDKNNQKIALKDIFTQLGVNPLEISLDSLDVQADKQMYKRFDRFNQKYNPLGFPKLREIFLKQDNYIKGRYLAEITKELINMLDDQQFIGCEWRISISGKSMEEWHKLGKWFVKNKLYSTKVRWLIQIPRLYGVYKKSNLINSFQDMLDNIFRPLYDITINPTLDPFLYQSLFQVVGFDTVDDESAYEHFSKSDLRTLPSEWQKERDPPYTYWIFYIYANLYSLNALRQQRGLNTFSFRPHCGEAGNIDHLATAYLMADGINHGIELIKSPVLTYLFYLKQIGIAMSPVSNNKLFCRYQKSPFLKYFKMGLNISLSTDDPLILHLTNEPLLEEYAIASQVFDLSTIDQAELARNSVKQSGFESIIKKYWVGEFLNDRIQEKNAENRNNLPQSRFMYRKITLNEEYERIEMQGDEILF